MEAQEILKQAQAALAARHAAGSQDEKAFISPQEVTILIGANAHVLSHGQQSGGEYVIELLYGGVHFISVQKEPFVKQPIRS